MEKWGITTNDNLCSFAAMFFCWWFQCVFFPFHTELCWGEVSPQTAVDVSSSSLNDREIRGCWKKVWLTQTYTFFTWTWEGWLFHTGFLRTSSLYFMIVIYLVSHSWRFPFLFTTHKENLCFTSHWVLVLWMGCCYQVMRERKEVLRRFFSQARCDAGCSVFGSMEAIFVFFVFGEYIVWGIYIYI